MTDRKESGGGREKGRHISTQGYLTELQVNHKSMLSEGLGDKQEPSSWQVVSGHHSKQVFSCLSKVCTVKLGCVY